MAGSDQFALMLEHLTEQLCHEHQREVNDLNTKINQLESELKLCTRSSFSQNNEHPARTMPSEVQGANRAKDVQKKEVRLTKEEDEVSIANGNSVRSIRSRFSAPKKLTMVTRSSRLKPVTTTYSSNILLAFNEKLVQSTYFEVTICFFIALNALMLAIEAQFRSYEIGADLGYDVEVDKHTFDAEMFLLFEWIFGIIFTVEIVLRIVGLRFKFFFDARNSLDLAITLVWLFSMLDFFSNLINPKIIQLTRQVKLVRLYRVIRQIHGSDSLLLLTTSLGSSVKILGWTCCVLFILQMLNALILNATLVEFYFQNDAFPLSERREVYRYCGSFTRSFFAMFELTLANWPEISRTLYENVNEWFILIAIIHKLTIGFAVVGVVNGVFIGETNKVAQQDDVLMLRRMQESRRIHVEKMKRLVATADMSGEGELDLDEFRAIFNDAGLQAWLASMELVPQDVDVLFQMMDDGNGTLSVDEMIKGVAKFKGNARNIDLHAFIYEQKKFQTIVESYLIRHSMNESMGPYALINSSHDRVSLPSDLRKEHGYRQCVWC